MSNNTWYYDIHEKIYIDSVFKDGRFVDPETNKPIILRENTRVRIATPAYGVQKEEEKKHKEVKRELFLRKGSEISFRFYYDSRSYEFKVILLKDLFLSMKGNQHSKLSACKCEIYKPNEKNKKDFEADSLNQAFTKASIKYRSNNKSHTCNVFKTYYYQEKSLEDIRPF